MESMLFPMSTLVGLGRGCRLRLSEAWWGLVMLNRTDSLTHGDCGNQGMVTIAELCLNRIESYTAGLSGYKYSTVAVDCNSGVWAFLLRAFCPNISCPISGIQPFFVSLKSDLEQIAQKMLYCFNICLFEICFINQRPTQSLTLVSILATPLTRGHCVETLLKHGILWPWKFSV